MTRTGCTGDLGPATIVDVTTRPSSHDLPQTRWEGDPPPVVLLHAGVADRRQWDGVGPHLGRAAVAYDRRGYGQAPPQTEEHSHLGDLRAVLESLDAPAWLVGNSMGGALALDAALELPDHVAGLVLLGSAVTGLTELPGYEEPPEAAVAEQALLAAEGTDLQAEAEVHHWLDGALAARGRVGGAVRELALEMARGVTADEHDSGTRAWDRLAEVRVPVVVAVGELDEPAGVEISRRLAQRLPDARYVLLPGTAHLPSLDAPERVVALVREALA